MTVEIHSAARPGRPVLLLLLSAGVLGGALGLAWLQVYEARAMGPETPIDGTPLVVRVPKDWQHSDDPSTFILPVRETVYEQQAQVVQRSIRFVYVEMPFFKSPTALQEFLPPNLSRVDPASVGPFYGIQVVLERLQRSFRGRPFKQQRVRRLACTPRGDVIVIEYVPLMELKRADLDQLEDISAAVRLTDPTALVPADEAMESAGVAFDAAAEWQFALPAQPVAGLYFSGSVGGVTGWSIRVFRTWLADERSGSDLLRDYVQTEWNLATDDADLAAQRQSDGLTVWTVSHRDLTRRPHREVLARVISRSDDEAVLLVASAGPQDAFRDAAIAAADRITHSLSFTPTKRLPDLASASAAGREFVRTLGWSSAMRAAWGQQERAEFEITGPYGTGKFALQREARGEPPRGYRGIDTLEQGAFGLRAEWQLDADAQAYEYEMQMREDRILTAWREHRAADSDAITRRVRTADGQRTLRFDVGPAYVCPPAESIIEWRLALRSEGAWLIQVSTFRGSGANTRLMRPLAPDEDGLRRVLLQDDYNPSQWIVLGFDPAGVLHYQRGPGRRMQRLAEGSRPSSS